MTYYSHDTLKRLSYLRSLLMNDSLRHLVPDRKFCHTLHLHVFEQMIPAALIRDVLTETQGWEEREKALNMPMVIVLIIAMGLFSCVSIPHVLYSFRMTMIYSCETIGLLAHCIAQ
jgi:Insertion element 4 transposase N-terminal